MALEELDRVDAIRRSVDELNLAGHFSRAMNKPEDLRDVAHEIQRAMRLSQQATDAMRDAETQALRQIEKLHRIHRRQRRKGTHGTV